MSDEPLDPTWTPYIYGQENAPYVDRREVVVSDGVSPMPKNAYRCPVCGDWFLRPRVRHLINVPVGECYHGDERPYVPAWEVW